MATVGQIIVGGIHSLYLIIFKKHYNATLGVKDGKKETSSEFKKISIWIYGKPKELPILVQYLGIKDEDQLKFSTKSSIEYKRQRDL